MDYPSKKKGFEIMSKNIPFVPTPIEILESSKMKSDEKILYISMLNTYKLSFINGDDWKDNNGIFIYYSIPRIQKSIGCSRPKAIKILNLLEKNGYIVKEHQDGKSTKIYLVQNEYTEFVIESMKDHKKNKKHKKVAPKKVNKKDKQEELINNEVGVVEEVIAAEPEVQTITDYTQNQSVFDVFKAIIGREPDKSFKKYITKRSMEMNITGENMRGIIEIARKARNPEAYIIAVIKSAQSSQQQTYQQEQQAQQAPEPAKDAPLNEDEIDWLLDLEYYKKRNDEEYSQARIDELEQMLEVIKQKKAEEDAKRPLEDWEIDWLNEQKRYEQSCEDEQSQTINQEVQYCLLE